jgi:large subunit ribosomal protein L16
MLSPKRTKYRKHQRGRLKGKACRNNKLHYGEYGIQALEPVWLTSRQIEAVRRTITRYTKRTGKLWIKVFPDKSVTARAEESRMGSGKGAVEYWVVGVNKAVAIAKSTKALH